MSVSVRVCVKVCVCVCVCVCCVGVYNEKHSMNYWVKRSRRFHLLVKSSHLEISMQEWEMTSHFAQLPWENVEVKLEC